MVQCNHFPAIKLNQPITPQRYQGAPAVQRIDETRQLDRRERCKDAAGAAPPKTPWIQRQDNGMRSAAAAGQVRQVGQVGRLNTQR